MTRISQVCCRLLERERTWLGKGLAQRFLEWVWFGTGQEWESSAVSSKEVADLCVAPGRVVQGAESRAVDWAGERDWCDT